MPSSILTLTLAALAAASPASKRQVPDERRTAHVDLSITRGEPRHLGSGILYGIPETPNQIPDSFYTEMGFNYMRAGGAQLEAGGWIMGLDEYYVRFNSTRSNYETTRKYGAPFILLPHDIWGTDASNDSTVWPGDNGDWTDYDNFLEQLTSDLIENNMLEGMIWDVWNEADLDLFWNREVPQFVELYVRTYAYLRQRAGFETMDITGPSYAKLPLPGDKDWTDWLAAVAENDAVPDQYSYHILGQPQLTFNDLAYTNGSLGKLLDDFGLDAPKIVNINEYGNQTEQVPSGAAWWLSRLERYDAPGLRANWLSRCQLHDFMAVLVSKPGAPESSTCDGGDYFTNGEYQVYKYYVGEMTGLRANTTTSNDNGLLDVYTTIADDKVRTLAGVRLQKGTWYISIKGLSAVGLPESGTLDIQSYEFLNDGLFGRIDAPADRGVVSHEYSGDEVIFPVFNGEDIETAYAFEFVTGN